MSNTNTELQNKYQKKSSKQHVLDNPDTYIGSIEHINNKEFIFNEETNTIIQKNIDIIPGLYKLFDEGIVNCRDHVIRMLQKIEKRLEKAGYFTQKGKFGFVKKNGKKSAVKKTKRKNKTVKKRKPLAKRSDKSLFKSIAKRVNILKKR